MSELLARIGWSQAQFARHFGLSQTTVSKWCREATNTPAYRLALAYLETMALVMKK